MYYMIQRVIVLWEVLMYHIHTNLFNPEIIYVVDFWNEKKNLRGYHHHDFIELSVVLEGEVDYEFNGERVCLKAGDALLFNPGISHTEIHPKGTDSHELHIGISNVLIEGLPFNHVPIKHPLLELGDYTSLFIEKAWQLTKEYNDQYLFHELVGKGIIFELLVLILRSVYSKQPQSFLNKTSVKDKKKQTLVNHTIYYLENHHQEDITLNKLADMLYISPPYLSKVFRSVTGVSPIKYLIEIRLKHASELLLRTSSPIKEIAEQVGYQDPFYFSKLFKKHYHLSPSDYRKSNRNRID